MCTFFFQCRAINLGRKIHCFCRVYTFSVRKRRLRSTLRYNIYQSENYEFSWCNGKGTIESNIKPWQRRKQFITSFYESSNAIILLFFRNTYTIVGVLTLTISSCIRRYKIRSVNAWGDFGHEHARLCTKVFIDLFRMANSAPVLFNQEHNVISKIRANILTRFGHVEKKNNSWLK